MEGDFAGVDCRVEEVNNRVWKFFGSLSTANVVAGGLLAGNPEGIIWRLPVALGGIGVINKVVEQLVWRKMGLGHLAERNDIRERELLADMDAREGRPVNYREFANLASEVQSQREKARLKLGI